MVGLSLRKDHPTIRPVRESGESYTLSEFEAKARAWEISYFKNCSIIKGVLSPLELKTLYWDAEVEYGNDMPGSTFVELDRRRTSGNVNVEHIEWNVRGAARAKGCPLRFVKDDIPVVTSPMVRAGLFGTWRIMISITSTICIWGIRDAQNARARKSGPARSGQSPVKPGPVPVPARA
ncbi:hypothetical protein AgCh_016104 [Apium graveolens]